MRKPVAILILMIFIFDAGGYYLWFSLVQRGINREVREEIARGLPDEQLIRIAVPAEGDSGIEWIKKGKEFRYQGGMFDVVRSTVEGHLRYYYCINDHKEKQLVAGMNGKAKKSGDKKLRFAFSFQYFPHPVPGLKNPADQDIVFPELNRQYQSESPGIHPPPPRRA